MLFTSNDRYNEALKLFHNSLVLCNCGKPMYPYSKPFGKSQPEFRFLMAKCDCGNHYKQLYEHIPELKEMIKELKEKE